MSNPLQEMADGLWSEMNEKVESYVKNKATLNKEDYCELHEILQDVLSTSVPKCLYSIPVMRELHGVNMGLEAIEELHNSMSEFRYAFGSYCSSTDETKQEGVSINVDANRNIRSILRAMKIEGVSKELALKIIALATNDSNAKGVTFSTSEVLAIVDEIYG